MRAPARSSVFLPTVCCFAGLFMGFAVIHPTSMLMNRHMSGASHQPRIANTSVRNAFKESFTTATGIGWGSASAAIFGLIGFLIGALLTRERALRSANVDLAAEKNRSDKLLLNILPHEVAEELKDSGRSAPRKFKNVSVLFSDIVGFSRIASYLPPEKLIHELNDIFTAFDNIMGANHCERIKTIGDGYLAVCGMPSKDREHALHLVRAAVGMIEFLEKRNRNADLSWKLRIGIHSGDVVGGVVGVRKYIYDVFGDTINCAARLEQHGAPMKINISKTTRNLVASAFSCVPRGSVEIKDEEAIQMYFIVHP